MKKTISLCFLLLFPALLLAQEDTVRLDDLLKQALERNPKIKSVGFEADAMSFRIPQESSLPDPMVSFSLKNMGFPKFTLGQEVMSGVGLSFSQAIPFPGRLGSKARSPRKPSRGRKKSETQSFWASSRTSKSPISSFMLYTSPSPSSRNRKPSCKGRSN